MKKSEIIKAIKKVCTFLDLKKTFDTFDHKLLLQKCADLCLRGPVLAFLQNYFSNRTQFVIAGAKASNLQKIDTGVPQGPVLRPILFLIYIYIYIYIYINDLPKGFSDIQITLFADDTSVPQTYKPDTGISSAN